MKLLLDTNIFVIDRFFHRDPKYPINRDFLNQCSRESCCFSIWSLFELTGISSFNLSEREVKMWFYDFESVYHIKVLSPQLYGDAEIWFNDFAIGLFEQIQKKATLGDAFILKEAECHNMDSIITWNKKDFEGRSTRQILTPEEFLNSI